MSGNAALLQVLNNTHKSSEYDVSAETRAPTPPLQPVQSNGSPHSHTVHLKAVAHSEHTVWPVSSHNATALQQADAADDSDDDLAEKNAVQSLLSSVGSSINSTAAELKNTYQHQYDQATPEEQSEAGVRPLIHSNDASASRQVHDHTEQKHSHADDSAAADQHVEAEPTASFTSRISSSAAAVTNVATNAVAGVTSTAAGVVGTVRQRIHEATAPPAGSEDGEAVMPASNETAEEPVRSESKDQEAEVDDTADEPTSDTDKHAKQVEAEESKHADDKDADPSGDKHTSGKAAAAGAAGAAGAGAAAEEHESHKQNGKSDATDDDNTSDKPEDQPSAKKNQQSKHISLTDHSSVNDFLEHGEQWLKQIEDLYTVDEEMIQSGTLYDKFTKQLKQHVQSANGSEKQKLQSLYKQSQDQNRFRFIAAMTNEITKCKQYFNADDPETEGFKHVGTNQGIKTFYRKNGSGESHTFLVSGEIECQLFDLLAIIYEMQFMEKWMPGINVSKKYPFDDSLFRMVVNIVVMKIFPFASREVILYGYGDVDRDQILVFFRSVDRDSRDPQDFRKAVDPVPKIAKSHVEAILHFGGLQIKPLDKHRQQIKFVTQCDPQLKIIPMWLLNWVTQKLCFMFIKIIREKTSNMEKAEREGKSDELLDQIRRNERNVYGTIQRRLEQHFPWLSDGSASKVKDEPHKNVKSGGSQANGSSQQQQSSDAADGNEQTSSSKQQSNGDQHHHRSMTSSMKHKSSSMMHAVSNKLHS